MYLEDAVSVYRADDNELMGYVAEQEGAWVALTLFGLPFAKTPDEATARGVVLQKGLSILAEPWEFYDAETKEWQRCVIVEATPTQVSVSRFDGGYPDPKHYHTINSPTERTLRYSAQ